MTQLHEIDGLSAADVMHRRVTTLPASSTVGELREYLGASGSRRLAILVEGERYVASIPGADLPEDAEGSELAASHAIEVPTIGPDASAEEARDLALSLPTRRVPVVDDAGTLLGIVAIDEHHTRFCG
jgi:CBS domain-containing protein